MSEAIINRVAKSKLVTFNLEDYYPEGARLLLDIKDWLYEGLILKEKDFRETVGQHDWSRYNGCYVALGCSTDAIIPAWAYMLITTRLAPYSKKTVIGTAETLENAIFEEVIARLDVSPLKGKSVIVKGCTQKPVPQNAYLLLIQKLQPVVKSLMYGEACASVPLYKRT